LLESGSHAALIAELVSRVDLRKGGMDLSMNLESLLPPDSAFGAAPWTTFTRFVPLRMKRRGVAMRLVIGARLPPAKLILLFSEQSPAATDGSTNSSPGEPPSLENSSRERVNERFVRRLIPLAFLSPVIVEAIVKGRQSVSLTAERISRGLDIPVEWDNQRAALGFE
jgi:site-specific DNA recombinase